MPQSDRRTMSFEEFLQAEDIAEARCEYHDRDIHPVPGQSHAHNRIMGNLIAWLHQELNKQDCMVYPGMMKVEVEKGSHYAYPDIAVVCGPPQFGGDRDDIIANPLLIAEVLSPESAEYDRGDKFAAYRKIASLSHYLLVAQDRVWIDYLFKADENRWQMESYQSPSDRFVLHDMEAEVSVGAVYQGLF